LHYGDLSDAMNLTRIIQETQPDEIYNLGAMSHVAVSLDTPEYVGNVDDFTGRRSRRLGNCNWCYN
jgi:GDPmannose 4,6-dehydratase